MSTNKEAFKKSFVKEKSVNYLAVFKRYGYNSLNEEEYEKAFPEDFYFQLTKEEYNMQSPAMDTLKGLLGDIAWHQRRPFCFKN